MIVAGTGHRPKFCPCKYKENHPWLLDLKERLKLHLSVNKIDTVITGMAIGWDTWLAQVAIEMNIPIHAYVPFKGQSDAWPTQSRKTYDEILKKSECVKYISESYSSEAFLKRDREMVDDCDTVLALLNPLANNGGTYYTVQYAMRNNVPVINFWKDEVVNEVKTSDLLLKGMKELTESIEANDIRDYKITIVNKKTGERTDIT